jgi:hypothetical protein
MGDFVFAGTESLILTRGDWLSSTTFTTLYRALTIVGNGVTVS